MAHKKGVGSTDNGRDSISKRLGVKIYGGQFAIAGNIIVRQRGTKFHPGQGVGLGKDHTIYATTDGNVVFTKKKNNRTYISVIPVGADTPELKAKPAPKKEKVVEAAPVVEETPVAAAPEATDKPDDLTKVEGIGPKIASTLVEAGVTTFAALSQKSPEEISEIIAEVRGNHITDTWPKQAEMAAAGQWDELKAWQDELDGGKA